MTLQTTEATVETPLVAPQQEDEARCPTCDAAVPAGFRFCGQCGRALAATLAPSPGDLLTIAFIDLEGFTTFASRVDDEEVRELIRSFHGLVRDEVGSHGGFEVKQMGDGFMLAFSNPAKALDCAVGIQRAVASAGGDGLSPSTRVSAGLNSGGAIRDGDDFFGHTVNVASRIAGRADGGQVLISEATRVLVGQPEGVRIIDRGRRTLRGIAPRHRLFEVVWWE